MLLLYFYDRKFDVVKITGDISEARAVTYHNKPRFFYYDDFLGQTAQADKLNKNEDQRLLDFMASVRDSKDSVFVLTTREYILNQAQLHYEKLAREKFDHRICIIDLSKYSRRIRAQILYNHLHFSKLPRTHLEALVAKRGYVKVVDHKNYNPRLIEHLTDVAWIGEVSAADYLAMFLSKLDNPVEIWEHAFRNQLTDKARHLLFILTTLPTESRLLDVEQAFTSFHNSQCARFGLPHSATDFTSALKELDGTFTATRMAQEQILVRFQNPSIRDFMQNLLLSGELLEVIITSLVFFEQARWFVDTLKEKQSQVSREVLARYLPQIVDALKRLVYANSCSFSIVGSQPWVQITTEQVNPAARLATIASFTASQNVQSNAEWIAAKLSEVVFSLKAEKLSASSIVGSVETLKELGHLDSEAGMELAVSLKAQTLAEPCYLDDFETLAAVINTLPESFDEIEVETVRMAYSDFADQYAIECDLNNPDELRDEASRIGAVGDLLQVDTDAAQDALKERADNIELEEPSDWDIDEYSRGGGTVDECSDKELDSIFGTLKI